MLANASTPREGSVATTVLWPRASSSASSRPIMRDNSVMDDLELEIKQLIVTVLKLDGLQPVAIDSVEPLFVEGLGLDSIDALELGVAIRKKYSVTFDAEKEDVKRHFLNVRNLAQFVRSQQERNDGHAITR